MNLLFKALLNSALVWWWFMVSIVFVGPHDRKPFGSVGKFSICNLLQTTLSGKLDPNISTRWCIVARILTHFYLLSEFGYYVSLSHYSFSMISYFVNSDTMLKEVFGTEDRFKPGCWRLHMCFVIFTRGKKTDIPSKQHNVIVFCKT